MLMEEIITEPTTVEAIAEVGSSAAALAETNLAQYPGFALGQQAASSAGSTFNHASRGGPFLTLLWRLSV